MPEPQKPRAGARRSGAPESEPLRRFYEEATVAPAQMGLADVHLDGRPVRTPAKAPLRIPVPIAERIALEWNDQGEHILPLTMPLTRLANTAIDGVAHTMDAVGEDVVRIANGDLVLYRADAPETLVARQKAHWDAVIAAAERRFGVRLVMAEGIMPVLQDPRLADAVRAELPSDPLRLSALHQLTTLTGSAFLAFAVARGEMDLDAAWTAAHVDEDWNIAEWGEDEEAMQRRAVRRRDAEAAAFVLSV